MFGSIQSFICTSNLLKVLSSSVKQTAAQMTASPANNGTAPDCLAYHAPLSVTPAVSRKKTALLLALPNPPEESRRCLRPQTREDIQLPSSHLLPKHSIRLEDLPTLAAQGMGRSETGCVCRRKLRGGDALVEPKGRSSL